MKGIVFNLLEDIVVKKYGDDTWDKLLTAAKLDGAYTSLGSYPDAQLLGLVGAASAALKLPPEAIVRWFGKECIPLFVRRYPQLFTPHKNAKSLVLTLNDIIHPEVRKLYPGADVPVFDYETNGANSVSLGYHSKRKLCAFAEGLVEGTAAHYGQTVTIKQPKCMIRGDPKCVLACEFSPAGAGRKAS